MKTNEEYRLLEQQLAHLKTCSATEICAENPNILAYCQQVEQRIEEREKQIVMLRIFLSKIAFINDSPLQSDLAEEALAATQDLKDSAKRGATNDI